jgi:hypothetical protein
LSLPDKDISIKLKFDDLVKSQKYSLSLEGRGLSTGMQ